eukprot:245894_1
MYNYPRKLRREPSSSRASSIDSEHKSDTKPYSRVRDSASHLPDPLPPPREPSLTSVDALSRMRRKQEVPLFDSETDSSDNEDSDSGIGSILNDMKSSSRMSTHLSNRSSQHSNSSHHSRKDGKVNRNLKKHAISMNFSGKAPSLKKQKKRKERTRRQIEQPLVDRDPAKIQKQVQLDHEQEQDDILVSMSEAVGRLTVVSRDIGNEFDEQKIALDDLNDDLDDTQSRMDIAAHKLETIIGRNTRNHCYIIIVLAVILCILLVIIV